MISAQTNPPVTKNTRPDWSGMFLGSNAEVDIVNTFYVLFLVERGLVIRNGESM